MTKAVQALLRQLDDAWAHRWESLTSVLEGVDAEEAAWQAPAYAAEEQEAGWPEPGTVHWTVAHIAHCKRHYTRCLEERGGTERPPETKRTSDADFLASRRELEAAHAAQRVVIATLVDEELGLTVGNAMDVREFLTMAVRHDIWHAGQIAVLRRLWRHRDA